jgi:hypothetical protein
LTPLAACAPVRLSGFQHAQWTGATFHFLPAEVMELCGNTTECGQGHCLSGRCQCDANWSPAQDFAGRMEDIGPCLLYAPAVRILYVLLLVQFSALFVYSASKFYTQWYLLKPVDRSCKTFLHPHEFYAASATFASACIFFVCIALISVKLNGSRRISIDADVTIAYAVCVWLF